MDATSKKVGDLYNSYPYPDYRDLTGRIQGGDPSLFSALLWPEGRPRDDLTILVAGCGTVQAAMIAQSNPSCHVTGTDLSLASLSHERMLQDTYNLTNLHLHHMDLRNVGTLGRTFDLIYCTGVLHHMRDPLQGLRALRSVLASHGAMYLLLYGATRRHGVYLMQDVFRRLNVPRTSDGIDLVRTVLKELPPQHFANLYLAGKPLDRSPDADVVDTYLHVQDRAYTVREVLQFVRDGDLLFQSWGENGYYYPDGRLSRTAVFNAMAGLADEDQWAITENVALLAGIHVFIAAHPDRSAAIDPFPFRDPTVIDRFPWRPRELKSLGEGKYKRGNGTFSLSNVDERLYRAIDGQRSIRECIKAAGLIDISELQLLKRFENLWRRGHLFISRVAV